MIKRVYILGATGAGKTAIAGQLSRHLGLPVWSTDDFAYKKRWNSKYNEKDKIDNMRKVARKDKWIIEGVHSGDWISPAIKRADVVIFLNVSLIKKVSRIMKRYKERRNSKNPDTLKNLIKLIYWTATCMRRHYIIHKKRSKKFIEIFSKEDLNKLLEEVR